MAARLARAIASGVAAEQTLGVTFTNRAAMQMRSQVEKELGVKSKHARVMTFHGLCAWMLREESQTLGLPRDFVVYDEEDQKEVMAEQLARLWTRRAIALPVAPGAEIHHRLGVERASVLVVRIA